MEKPRVFIGSSKEGLALAEAVFADISQETEPTIWKHDIFLPSRYPLEALEKQLKVHSFAILIASPDDILIKRDNISSSMRDNILLEFGLFTGVLGRKRTFLMLPQNEEIAIPSDLLGIIPAKYDEKRLLKKPPEVASAVQVACAQIRQVIKDEWFLMLKETEKLNSQIRDSIAGQSINRLYDVSIQLRDVIMMLQRDAFEAISDRRAFDTLKKAAAQKVLDIAKSFKEDALNVGVENELNELTKRTKEALLDLPFPEELDVSGEDWTGRAIDAGLGALGDFLGGRDPIRKINKSAENEFEARISGLKRRFSRWWDKHVEFVQPATTALQDALFRASINLGSSVKSH